MRSRTRRTPALARRVRGSLRVKIIAWSFIPAAIILTAVALVTYYAYQRVTEDLVIERDRELARLTAVELANSLQDYPDLLSAVAREFRIMQDDPDLTAEHLAPEHLAPEHLAQARHRLVLFDGGVFALNHLGRVVAAEPERPETIGQDWSTRPYFRRLVGSMGDPVFSSILANGPSGADAIAVAVPIVNDRGEFLGAMAGMFRLGASAINPFYGTILRLRLERSGDAYVVDGNGRAIYASDPDRIGSDFSTYPVSTDALSGRVGAIRTRALDGRDILASFGPVPNTSWSLVIEESWETLMQPSLVYGQFLLALLALGVVIPAVVVAIGVRRITGPIAELVEASRQVAGGDFGQTVSPNTGDELEDLADQFNRMSGELKASYAQLERDLAELKRIEHELRRSEELYRTLARNFPNGAVILFDADLRYILADGAGLAEVGLSKEMLEGKTIWEIFPADVVEILEPRYRAALAGQASAFEVSFAERTYALHALPIRDERGEIVAGMAMTQDITARKQTEAQLRASEAELRALFAAMTDVILVLDAQGRYLKVAPTNPALLYRPSDELIGRTLHDVFPADQADMFLGHAQEALRTGQTVNMEYSLPIAGREVWFAASVSPMSDDTVLMVARDTTERRQAEAALREREEQYRGIFESTTDGLFINTLDGQLVDFNPSAAHMHGYTPEEFRQLQPSQFIHPDSLHVFAEYIEAVKSGQLFRSQAVDIRKDGTPFYVEVLGSGFTYRGQPHTLAVVRDISEQVQAQELLERRVEQRTRELQRRAEQFRVINEVGQRITSILAVDEILSQTVRLIRESFGRSAYHVHIGLIEKDVVAYKSTAGVWRDEPDCRCCTSLRLRVGLDGITGLAAGSGEPILVPDVSQEPRYIPVQDGQTGSELALPLKVKGRVIGVLNVESERLNAFDESDVTVLQSLANQLAVAIENARLFETEQRRADQFRAINEVGRHITSILTVDDLLAQTVRLIQETFRYYFTSVGLIEGDQVIVKYGDPLRLRVGQEGIIGWVARAGEPLLVPDVRQDSRYVASPSASQTRSELAVPIKSRGQSIGVLDVESDRVNAFDESDVAVVQALANQLGVAIENARLYESEQRRAEQFRVLAEVGRHITSILDVDQLLSQTVQLMSQAFGYYHVGVAMIEGEQAIYRAGAGALWKEHLAQFQPPKLKVGQEGITGWVAGSGEPLLVPDVSQDSRYVWMEGSQTRSELALPILAKDRTIGVLDVQSDRADAFDQSDLVVLQSLANQLAVAIENARLYEQAQQLAALEERQKLARELHDSVSQALYGIALGAKTARTLLDRDPIQVAQPLDYVLSLAEAGLAEMRALIFELRPESLEMEGLVAALTKQTASLHARYHIEVQTAFGDEPRLPLPAKETLYRIAQEALNNIVKHARASRVDVRLELADGSVRLEIGDNGVGFDPKGEFPGHLGLRSMRERAEKAGGTLAVESAPGQGARIRVRIPVNRNSGGGDAPSPPPTQRRTA
ncbi:MAG TPA: GAF domain-containing protein [Anaerolineae bacterium]|nr:GAF domain-containing protein [Anaerolineae bacterium]